MKCKVCGNEIESNLNKCDVCGTMVDKGRLGEALSNISSIAKALRTNRAQTIKNSQEKNATKALDLNIDDLYIKDLDIEPKVISDEEFDLDSFYENYTQEDEEETEDTTRAKRNPVSSYRKSKQKSVEYDEREEEEEYEEEDSILEEQEGKEYLSGEAFDELPEEDEEDIEEDVVQESEPDEVETKDEAIEEVQDSTPEKTEAKQDVVTEEVVEDTSIVEDDEISSTANEIEYVDLDEIDFEDEEETGEQEDISQPAGEYIKQEDIVRDKEEVVVEKPKEDAWTTFNIGGDVSVEPQPVVQEESTPQNIPVQQAPAPEPQPTSPQGQALGNIFDLANQDAAAAAPVAAVSESVKAEDVPYTDLPETKSDVSDNKPIVIDDKDVVGAAKQQGDVVPNEEPKKKTKEKKKDSKLAGIFAFLFSLIGAIVGGALVVYDLQLSGVLDWGLPLDFIADIITTVDMKVYFAIGAVVVAFLGFILGIVNAFKRKGLFRFILLIITLLILGGLIYIYYDSALLEAILLFFGIEM